MAVELVGIETCYRRGEEIPARFKSCPCGWLPPRRPDNSPLLRARNCCTAVPPPLSCRFPPLSDFRLVSSRLPASVEKSAPAIVGRYATFAKLKLEELARRGELGVRQSLQVVCKLQRSTGILRAKKRGNLQPRKWAEIIAESGVHAAGNDTCGAPPPAG